MLLLTNRDVMQVLTMGDCMAALEEAFRDLAEGTAVERPRSHTYTPLGPDRYYLFKSMDGGLARRRLHAIRITSDLIQETRSEAGWRREKLAAAPGGRWVGMVLLFSMDTLEPLALVQDGFLQRTRVGATSALAVRELVPPGVEEGGMVGSGWQAGAQVLGLAEALPGLRRLFVYSPNREHREAFCREFQAQGRLQLVPVARAAEALRGRRLWILATNALEPVVDGRWLSADTHVNSIQGRELDSRTLERADRVVVRARVRPSHHAPPGFEPREMRMAQERKVRVEHKLVELGEVLSQGFHREPGWVTLFAGGGSGGSSGLGVQFAAVTDLVYRRAREAGLGTEVDPEFFRQEFKP